MNQFEFMDNAIEKVWEDPTIDCFNTFARDIKSILFRHDLAEIMSKSLVLQARQKIYGALNLADYFPTAENSSSDDLARFAGVANHSVLFLQKIEELATMINNYDSWYLDV